MSEQKTGYETIVLGDMSERAATSVWENVAGLAKRFFSSDYGQESRELFEQSLIDDEHDYMSGYHMDKGDMYIYHKKKPAKLNKRKYLPAKYRTAKSVAANCIEHGVKMHDSDGNVLAKSKCEKLIKAAKQQTTSVSLSSSDTLEIHSSFKEAQKLLDKLDKVWKDLNGGEREWVSDEVSVRYEYK